MRMIKPQEIQEIMVALGFVRPNGKPDFERMASRCGVTSDAIRKWARGDREPTGSAIVVLNMLADEAAALPKGKR